jgi:hypothetical protein
VSAVTTPYGEQQTSAGRSFSIALVEEDRLRRSEPIEGTNEVYLLVTSYPEKFGSRQEAEEAIQRHALGPGMQGVCISIKYFSKATSLTYQPSA